MEIEHFTVHLGYLPMLQYVEINITKIALNVLFLFCCIKTFIIMKCCKNTLSLGDGGAPPFVPSVRDCFSLIVLVFAFWPI